jgi:hypothetical protein
MDRIRQKAPTFLELGANIGPCGKMTDDDADSGMAIQRRDLPFRKLSLGRVDPDATVIINEAPGVEIGSEEGE